MFAPDKPKQGVDSMNSLPRALLEQSGLSAAALGDITQIPAYKIRRAASGERVLDNAEYIRATRVCGVYAQNREVVAKKAAATMDLLADDGA
jgi:hypothetical protein